MSISIVLAILITSLATFSSRFLGAVSSEGIKETSKLFKWFNCLAYATLAALTQPLSDNITVTGSEEINSVSSNAVASSL